MSTFANSSKEGLVLTYYDLEATLKRVPVKRLPEVYEFILARAEWPFEATPAAMEADDQEWDRKLTAEASQRLFERMAAQVRTDIANGETEPLEQLLTEDEANDEIADDAPVQTTVSPTPH